MPMIDALWPEDALTPEAEAWAVQGLTDIIVEAEGYELVSPISQLLAGWSKRDAGVGRLARYRLAKAHLRPEAALDAERAGITSKASLERAA